MSFINKLTLVFTMIAYSLLAEFTKMMPMLPTLIVSFIFWVTYFWWFDSTFISRQEVEDILKGKENGH